MRTWKLFWVTAPSADENCFVVAVTARQAASLEESASGFDPGACDAEFIASIPNGFEQIAKRMHHRETGEEKLPWPEYAQPWLLRRMGADERMRSGRTGWLLNGRFFAPASFEESFGEPPADKPFIIETVDQLLEKAWTLTGERGVFRGHADALWELRSTIHRNKSASGLASADHVASERQLLHEFKLRAVPFVSHIPRNDFEWLFLAQHHGLPTRLLDWTSNPLVALFFAVRIRSGSRDGAVVAYKHGRPIYNMESNCDPFSVARIELCEPPHLSMRIAAQSGLFTLQPPLIDPSTNSSASLAETWPVSYRWKERIRVQLGKLGISEGTMFPGLDGICRDITNANRRKAKDARASEDVNRR